VAPLRGVPGYRPDAASGNTNALYCRAVTYNDKKMKQTFIMALIVSIPILSLGQVNYFETDSSSSIGINLIDGTNIENSQVCKVKIRDKVIEYSPYEISDYGFKDGRVYVSKEIHISDTSKRVFLERLLNEKTVLYFYKEKGSKTFFLEKDSTIFNEIPKKNVDGKNYREQLAKISNNCQNTSPLAQLVSYNKNSLVKFFKLYNNCKLRPFPHLKYGPTLGYEFVDLIPPNKNQLEYINYFNLDYDGSFSVGMFFDYPIIASDFSIHTEILISKHGFSYNKTVEGKDMDFVANLSSLKLPLLLRYTYPSNKLRPFLNIGISNLYYLRDELSIYETTTNKNTIIINNVMKTSLINKDYLEYTIGGGVDYQLNCKNSVFFELRYSKSIVTEFLGTKCINIITGFNF
jgi:hypothetical protein